MSATDQMSTRVVQQDQLFDKFASFYSHISDLAPGTDLRELYNAIDDKEWLKAVLSKYDENGSSALRQSTNVTFKHSTDAGCGTKNFVFYLEVDIFKTGIRRTFKGRCYGVGGLGGTITGGTLEYDSLDDLVGRCDIKIAFLGPNTEIQFLKNKLPIAEYHGGGIGQLGAFNGHGTWR